MDKWDRRLFTFRLKDERYSAAINIIPRSNEYYCYVERDGTMIASSVKHSLEDCEGWTAEVIANDKENNV